MRGILRGAGDDSRARPEPQSLVAKREPLSYYLGKQDRRSRER